MADDAVALALGRSERTACEANGWRAGTLLLRGLVTHVVFCGQKSWLTMGEIAITEAEAMFSATAPLPEGSYTLETHSTSTVANMILARPIVKTGGWRTLVIVCIPYASWRARYLARKVFGKEYRIKVATSDYPFPGGLKERLRVVATEAIGLILTWRGLCGITPGDVDTVQKWWCDFQERYYARRK